MNEAGQRRHLAAAFRWTARFGWHEAVANHYSAVLPGSEHLFLLNPRGRHFSRIKASELLLLDARDVGRADVNPLADPTAWYLHAHLHQHVPRARVVLHTHMPYATALACIDGYEFQMLDQNACRFFRRFGYDRNYNGMFLDDSEGERVVRMLDGGKSVLFLGNHGVMVIGETVAEAFDELYYLEQACRLQVLALSTGRPLSLLADDVAERTCTQWFAYPADVDLHFLELLAILEAEEPDFAS